MKKIGVVLSGCGVYDGAEIHESVITLWAISKHGGEALCMAPDRDQMHVINHLTGQIAQGEKRNVLVESARIARGNIKNIKEVSAKDIDALILPGGFGAAKNLCDFAVKGGDCEIDPGVKRLVSETLAAKKPVGAICISPALLAAICKGGPVKPQVTIGYDPDTAKAINSMGARHVDCQVREFVVDRENRIVTTPAYMLAKNISEAADGIEKLVKEVMGMIGG
ncbi:MAG: isoprenoid biosynthesis glyoxalase ElbB [Nitrospinae bacterium]|nr:isoprenoid biosynthesis glyoxalase ElbB [Nitrospinota bacterium]